MRQLTDKEKSITEIIYNEIDYMYCDNCRYHFEIQETDACEDCHRKYNGWALSKSIAEHIACKLSDGGMLND